MTDPSRPVPDSSPLERAEQIVARLERRAAEEVVRLAAQAVEEAQDLWAEARALRRRDASG